MATEYTCITRKIEVRLHRHGDSEEDLQRYKDEFHMSCELGHDIPDLPYLEARDEDARGFDRR